MKPLLVTLFVIALLIGLLSAMVPTTTSHPPADRCMFNLKLLAGLFQARQAGGRLEYPVGQAFFLQFRDELRTEDLKVFRCSEGPEDVFISYRGPDAAALKRLRKVDGKSDIIACDANGENGDEPHHEDGICVLYETGKVEFIQWEEMEGYDGGPVKVGPDSPDPRFRHLVR